MTDSPITINSFHYRQAVIPLAMCSSASIRALFFSYAVMFKTSKYFLHVFTHLYPEANEFSFISTCVLEQLALDL